MKATKETIARLRAGDKGCRCAVCHFRIRGEQHEQGAHHNGKVVRNYH